MLKRILVPIDGSPDSEQAIPVAQQIASAQDAEVLLVQIAQFPSITDGQFQAAALYQELLDAAIISARENLASLAGRFKTAGIRARTVLASGSPPLMLLNIEREEQPDLVVMSSHGRTGLARLALGSVSDRMVREGTAPVLIVREPSSSASLSTALVMLDGSGVAEGAFPMIELLAGHPLQTVKLFRAVSDPWDIGVAGNYLIGVAERLHRFGVETEWVVELGEPALMLERFAEGADLIVLCTHGRGGFDRLRHGSVAERVVREAHKPVLLIRAGATVSAASNPDAHQPATIGGTPMPSRGEQ